MDQRQSVFQTFKIPDPIRIDKVFQIVSEHFNNDIKGIAVLECGPVEDGLADRMTKLGSDCYGVDINPRNLQGVKTYVADLNEGFPAFGKKFDVIFAGEIMEHIFDDDAFLANCKNLLSPRGILILTVPNLFFLPNRFSMLFGKMPKFSYEKYHYHIYGPAVLKSLFEDSGLEIFKFTSSHILFSTRRSRMGRIFEILGDIFPSLGAHLIVAAMPRNKE